jgi:hypothetical protein
MSILDQLGIKHNTDKASRTRVRDLSIDVDKRPPGHNFLVRYEHFLQSLTHKADLKMLELGAGPDWNIGASAQMWADYFPNCKEIHIAEIRPAGLEIRTDRIHPRIGDISDPHFLDELGETQWDFILDDCSHRWDHQIIALATLISSVNHGGIYILEDIQTSFGDLRKRYRGSFGTDQTRNIGPVRQEMTWYQRAIRRGGAFLTRLLKLKYQFNNATTPDAMTILSEIAYCVAGGDKYHPTLESSTNYRLVKQISMQLQSITFIEGSAILVKKSRDNTYLS